MAQTPTSPDIHSIPLPTEVPPPPRLQDVPARILHSATVETLLDHTEDLASRLKVHIRRNGQLEGQLIELETQIQDSELMRQTLLAQIEILREKDKSVADRTAAAEAKLKRSHDEADLARLEAKELLTKNRELQISAARAWSFRRRVKRWVSPGIEAREQQLKLLRGRTLELEAEVLRLSAMTSSLREELTHQRAETDKRLTSGERDRSRLVEHYENQLHQLSEENKRLENQLTGANQKVDVLDQTTRESAKANNQRIYFERRSEELEAQLQSETSRLQAALDDIAGECSALRASVETSRRLKDDADRAKEEAEAAKLRADSQLKSLRDIWQENSVRLQALEVQNEALEKLNAELSRKLSAAREEAKLRVSSEALNKVGFIESSEPAAAQSNAREEKLRKLDLILSDLEMKAFGIQPPAERSSSSST